MYLAKRKLLDKKALDIICGGQNKGCDYYDNNET